MGNLIASLDVMSRDKSWRRRLETSNFDEFKGKDCVFVVYTSCVPYLKVLKNDLCLWYINMCCLINHAYMHSFSLVIFPGVGAFEQLFGPVRKEFEQKFSKNSNARGLPGGMLKLRCDWYII